MGLFTTLSHTSGQKVIQQGAGELSWLQSMRCNTTQIIYNHLRCCRTKHTSSVEAPVSVVPAQTAVVVRFWKQAEATNMTPVKLMTAAQALQLKACKIVGMQHKMTHRLPLCCGCCACSLRSCRVRAASQGRVPCRPKLRRHAWMYSAGWMLTFLCMLSMVWLLPPLPAHSPPYTPDTLSYLSSPTLQPKGHILVPLLLDCIPLLKSLLTRAFMFLLNLPVTCSKTNPR